MGPTRKSLHNLLSYQKHKLMQQNAADRRCSSQGMGPTRKRTYIIASKKTCYFFEKSNTQEQYPIETDVLNVFSIFKGNDDFF